VTLNNAKNAFTTLKERQDHNHLDFVLINKFKIAILRIPEKRHLKTSYIGCCGRLSSFSLIFIILSSITTALNDWVCLLCPNKISTNTGLLYL